MKKLSKKAWRKKRIHHLSPTGAISKFVDCPLQFWFYKIAKIEDKSDEKPYLVFGNALHAAHEEALNLKQNHKDLTAYKSDILGKFTKTMVEDSASVPKYLWGSGGIDEHITMGTRMVDMLVDRYNKMPIKPIAVEKAYSVPYNKELFIECRIDLIAEFTDNWVSSGGVRVSKGDILIIDHKTASQKYKPNAVHISDQLTMYALVVRQAEGIREDGVMFQTFMKYKTPEIQDYCSQRNNRDVDILTEKIECMIKMIDQGLFYPTLKPDICNWCDYTALCPTYAIKEKREEYEKLQAKEEGFLLV